MDLLSFTIYSYPYRWGASISHTIFVQHKMQTLESLLALFYMYIFLWFILLEMFESIPIAMEIESIISVASGIYGNGKNHLKHAIYACTWKDLIRLLRANRIHTNGRKRKTIEYTNRMECNRTVMKIVLNDFEEIAFHLF